MTKAERIKARQMCPFIIRGGQGGLRGYICTFGCSKPIDWRQCDINCERLESKTYEDVYTLKRKKKERANQRLLAIIKSRIREA